ncbi:proline dehydrogenase family protein [Neobacillus ginsengisoli]|uniref:Proline dehydrogenase n=1 Tax=Neobacillus ginsengisoli TaxID=904295 RepID=A0ABT9Y104_9BACI|nr:proline dehydrogenase family protein [Neobacillus ginsengisoli]MDQ0201271.1 proline dehydrogenase [Neobacillus ginsengisoli]
MLKDFFIALSQNQLLNSVAKKYGLKMGAQSVVAGTNIEEAIQSIKELNRHGISCTIDNLGEFVFEKEEAIEARNQILKVIESIPVATHDHRIINHVKEFVKRNHIPNDKFEFQMLYGFRKDLQLKLASEGYNFCTYVPFGKDWYGYFMRRLAERPQNLNLVAKQVFNKKTNTMIGLVAGTYILGRLSTLNKKKRKNKLF